MKRSNIPMLRQHSHPPPGGATASSILLSPTTTAAKAGIKLNDPALRNVAVTSTISAAPDNAAAGASTDITMVHANDNTSGLSSNSSVKNSGNESSTMTTNRRKLPPFTLVRTTSIDKENNNNSKVSHYKDSKPSPSAAVTATDMDSLIDELDDTCDSESVTHHPNDQMMNYHHEAESIMADENEMSNGSTQQNEAVGAIRSSCDIDIDDVENHDMKNQNGFEEDGNDSDGTECSGQTVVAIERPPAGLTQEELNKYYWEICYGPGYVPPPTVLKSVPTKSW